MAAIQPTEMLKWASYGLMRRSETTELIDNFVGEFLKMLRHDEAECFRSLEVDRQHILESVLAPASLPAFRH